MDDMIERMIDSYSPLDEPLEEIYDRELREGNPLRHHHDWHMEMVNRRIWVDKNMNTTPIGQMSNRWLLFAIRFIERGAKVYGYAGLYYPLLLEEAEKRKLDLLPP